MVWILDWILVWILDWILDGSSRGRRGVIVFVPWHRTPYHGSPFFLSRAPLYVIPWHSNRPPPTNPEIGDIMGSRWHKFRTLAPYTVPRLPLSFCPSTSLCMFHGTLIGSPTNPEIGDIMGSRWHKFRTLVSYAVPRAPFLFARAPLYVIPWHPNRLPH